MDPHRTICRCVGGAAAGLGIASWSTTSVAAWAVARSSPNPLLSSNFQAQEAERAVELWQLERETGLILDLRKRQRGTSSSACWSEEKVTQVQY